MSCIVEGEWNVIGYDEYYYLMIIYKVYVIVEVL